MTTRRQAATAVMAAEDAMMVHGRTEATETALASTMAAYWGIVAADDHGLQAVLAQAVGEALAAADARLTISAERVAELVEAADIPQGLRDRLLRPSDGASDGLVHWRGLDSQQVFVYVPAVLGLYRPTRCGRWESATLGYPLEYVTCPKCRDLAMVDGFTGLTREAYEAAADEADAAVLAAFEGPMTGLLGPIAEKEA